MFVYDTNTPAAIAHNDAMLKSICTNPVLFRNLFPIPITSRLYYSSSIIYPPIYSFPEFGFKGITADAELWYLGIVHALVYKPTFPSYIPHSHTDILDNLRITAPNGSGPYIYGGGKFLKIRRLFIYGCKYTPFHIEAFD